MKNEVKKLMIKFDEGLYDCFIKKIMKLLGFVCLLLLLELKEW